jgi:hypothetical protein
MLTEILVIISEASIVTVLNVVFGEATSVKSGAVKVFGCQLSRKKPMDGAILGSVAGMIVTKLSFGELFTVSTIVLEHEKKEIPTKLNTDILKMKVILIFL